MPISESDELWHPHLSKPLQPPLLKAQQLWDQIAFIRKFRTGRQSFRTVISILLYMNNRLGRAISKTYLKFYQNHINYMFKNTQCPLFCSSYICDVFTAHKTKLSLINHLPSRRFVRTQEKRLEIMCFPLCSVGGFMSKKGVHLI